MRFKKYFFLTESFVLMGFYCCHMFQSFYVKTYKMMLYKVIF